MKIPKMAGSGMDVAGRPSDTPPMKTTPSKPSRSVVMNGMMKTAVTPLASLLKGRLIVSIMTCALEGEVWVPRFRTGGDDSIVFLFPLEGNCMLRRPVTATSLSWALVAGS